MQRHTRRLGLLPAFTSVSAGIFTGVFSVGTALLFLLGSGCASHPAVLTGDAVSPRQAGKVTAGGSNGGGLVETREIDRSPVYRQAIFSYKHRDYRDALARIDGLLKTPDLSDSARAFLGHQHEICEAAVSGHKLADVKSSATRPASQPANRPVRSVSNADCGPRALLLVCQQMKIPASLDALRKTAGTTADGTTMAGLAKAAHSVGLKADGVQMDRNALSNLSKPAVSWTDGNHYIAVLAVHHSLMNPVNGDTATVHDPNKQGEEEMPLDGPTGLLARSGGMVLLLSRENRIASAAVPTH